MLSKIQMQKIKIHSKELFIQYGDNSYTYRDVYEKALEFLNKNKINIDLGLNIWYYNFN